jgi:4-alpha-glucanotransferase
MQWRALRQHAAARGVRIFGDLPIYVAPDSVATWVHRRQFQLDANGMARAVAGVPPDYFAEDGQLWGNPLYDWDAQRREGFRFWLQRLQQQADRFDLLRIDHFRALEAYWSVPAGSPTAREGTWRKAPGAALLKAVAARLPQLELVAEDLGVITPEVTQLRQEFHLPGMRVLQFGFDGDAGNPHLPHQHEADAIVYTGTHDNDTTVGWYASLPEASRDLVRRYLGRADHEVPDAMIRAALASVARMAVLPVQDLLKLGSEARLNRPGTVSGNWKWRLPLQALTADLAARYRDLVQLHNRGSMA